MYFPLEFRVWNGQHMMDALQLSLDEQVVEVWCPDEEKRIRLPLSSITLLPYTGCVDLQNRKIFVSDMVYVRHMLVSNVPPYKAIIEWDKYRFALRILDEDRPPTIYHNYTNLDTFGLDISIIGNKHTKKHP